jgi:hypothetical protein
MGAAGISGAEDEERGFHEARIMRSARGGSSYGVARRSAHREWEQ